MGQQNSYYRRNTDSQLRSAERQFESGQITADYMATLLARAGAGVELLQVHEVNKEVNVHINLELGTADSVVGPWDLDEPLLELTTATLVQFYPNQEEYDGDFKPLESEEVFRVCPDLLSLLDHAAQSFEEPLGHLAKFLVSYVGWPQGADEQFIPVLTMVLNIAQGATYDNRHRMVQNRLRLLHKLFGEVSVVVYAYGTAVVENKPLGPLVESLVAKQPLNFTGRVALLFRYLDVIQLYPHFTVLGGTVEDWRNYIWNAIRHSPEIPGYFKDPPTQCLFEDARGPITGVCLGLAIKISSKTGELYAGSTGSAGVRDVEAPGMLLTWFWVFTDNGQAPAGEFTDFQVYMIEGTKVSLLTNNGDLPSEARQTSAQTQKFIVSLKKLILERARNEDGTIRQIIWLD